MCSECCFRRTILWRKPRGGEIPGAERALHAEGVVFVFDVEASDVGMEGNLLCDVGDTALLRGHETRKGFSQKGSARLVDVLDIRIVSYWYRRD